VTHDFQVTTDEPEHETITEETAVLVNVDVISSTVLSSGEGS